MPYKKTNKIIAITVVLLLGLFILGFIFFTQDKPETFVLQKQSPNIALGQLLYQQNCALCHGKNLEGQANWRLQNADGILPAPPHDETGHTWHHDDETLFNYTKFGGVGIAKKLGYQNPNSNMPAFEYVLNDSEIISILHYIKSTWPQKIRDIQSAKNAD